MKTPFFIFTALTGFVCCSAFGSTACRLLARRAFSHSHSDRLWLEMRAKKQDASSIESGVSKVKRCKSLAPYYSPKTVNQKTYWKHLNDPNISIVLGIGPAGTGKTLFACNTAIQLLKRGDIQKIVLTRPVVAVEEELGFLPGNLVMKMDPWTRPIFDILLEYYSQKDVDAMVQSGVIEISPLAYMRGRTFKRAFIIADEMQNSSPNQMMMLTTRIGEGSKMVITGDLKQSDRAVENGLLDITRKLSSYLSYNPTDDALRIRSVEMSMQDVERSAVVKQVLALYETPAYRVSASHGPALHSPSSNVTISEFEHIYTNSSLTCSSDSDTSSVVSLQDNENTQLYLSSLSSKNSTVQPDDPYNNGAFELVTYNDDAALIPKKHISKRIQNEDYHNFSSSKWTGW
jgi:phosphate starvation-inducible PhoH-like protein